MTIRDWLRKLLTFEGWMGVAEIIDAMRLYPRTVLFAYLVFAAHFVDRVLQFYFDLPSDDKNSVAIAGFCGVVITFVTGLGAKLFDLYNAGARDWAAYHAERNKHPKPRVTEETVVATKTTTGGTP